ncbi:MAG TPA: UvrD-helicase domain-containing protein [Anaeromyxobacteraceae bacterium]
MTPRRRAPDHDQREAAIHARGVNVIADAGAGTGKTTLLVARLVELVAPCDDGAALSLPRVAAITFTRKAAGELKLRIREALLRELAKADLSARRRERLAAALSALDTAHVGTIHSFADRLLRLRPVEARLSPSYDIVDDAGELVAETFSAFLQAVETGTLADELHDARPQGERNAATALHRDLAALAEEAQATIVDALRAGMRVQSVQHQHGEYAGLDRLFDRLIETRDVPPVAPPATAPDLGRFRELVDELAGLAARSRGEGAGSRFIARTLTRLQRLRDLQDPVPILAELLRLAHGFPKLGKRDDFPDDDGGWRAYKALGGDSAKNKVRETAIVEDLLRPFGRWMGRRLVRTAPAVVATYEKVKARHRAVDQVDLLLQLRNLLRDRLDVRAEYQALFDHVLVDELQDTDPLQAEIVLYLCEQGAAAKSWRDVALVPGKLTIVGDPKQSIYRFRRADIAVYAEVRAIVERGPHLVAKLSANFRSEPSLLAWLNGRFDDVLGKPEPGMPIFDPGEGTVVNEPLLAGREGTPSPRVQLLPLASQDRRKPAFRAAEAKAVAAYLRWLVEGERRTIVDPVTGAPRPARYGDVAVLAGSTFNLPLLFPELDRLGVPYAARGGTLFLSDPLHRQFLLALRAIADGDDGVAQAALMRPPFFALDDDDLARERAAGEGSTHPGVVRARAAVAMVRDLRRRRLSRSPGATARDLLERTAFGRAVALGPNGAQRLDALRELCLALDALAASAGLDLDAATARVRAWAIDPVQLDPPRPVASDAVQVLSIHQAKGLEFPVVVLWDACADLQSRDVASTYSVSRDGTAWALALDGIEWEEPAGADVARRERKYLDAERKRLVYVAATRARDLLVLPVAGAPNPAWVTGRLVTGAPKELMDALEPYAVGAEPAWACERPAPPARVRGDASALAAEVDAAWRAAALEAARPRFAPAAVTSEAHRMDEERPGEAGAPRPPRASRFGPVFGETVHRALGLSLAQPGLGTEAAVERAAGATGLAGRRGEAVEDVRRALAALERAGLRRASGPDLQLEYPVALARDGRLVTGYVDLLGMREGQLTVIDFKTDAPPPGDVAETHGAYVEQVRTYASILEALGLAAPGSVAAGLLFTAEGEVRWVGRG